MFNIVTFSKYLIFRVRIQRRNIYIMLKNIVNECFKNIEILSINITTITGTKSL